MKSFLKSLVVVALLLAFLPAEEVSAQAGGFVQCSGADCSACNLVSMINTIIIWLFGMIFVLFAILMAVAGFGLVTSGGNQAALDAAKSKFQNALVGIIIVMAGWLIVDTIMKGTLAGGTGEISGYGPWSEVKCQVQTVPDIYIDINTSGTTPPVPGQGQVSNSTSTSACSVQPLTQMTTSQALSMEAGNSVIFNDANLQRCATNFVSAVGGGARVNSAYRPAEYQTHLWQIRDRWCTQGLANNNTPACSSLRSAISAEVSRHFGSSWSCGAVAQNSRHSSNGAVDIGGISNHSASNVRAAASANCLVWRNYPGDPVHYDLISGCTCN
jgi:hypothetical protein